MIATPAYRVRLVGDSVVAPAPAVRPRPGSLGPGWLFANAELAARAPSGRVDLTFDPRYGLPTRISTNPSRCVMDDETEIRVSDITAGGPAG